MEKENSVKLLREENNAEKALSERAWTRPAIHCDKQAQDRGRQYDRLFHKAGLLRSCG